MKIMLLLMNYFPSQNGFVQASDSIATAYAELRNAGANAKVCAGAS